MQITVSFSCLYHDRPYFSRLTRERRRHGNEPQTTVDQSQVFLDNDEDLRSQGDEDESDF